MYLYLWFQANCQPNFFEFLKVPIGTSTSTIIILIGIKPQGVYTSWSRKKTRESAGESLIKLKTNFLIGDFLTANLSVLILG